MHKPKPLWEMAVEVPGGCWAWAGYVNASGYGQYQRSTPAHRAVYLVTRGLTNDEVIQVDHLCGTRHCVNPLHLQGVTQAENSRRAGNQYRFATRCKHGHAFTPENTAIRGDNGQRLCIACRVVRNERRRRQARAA